MENAVLDEAGHKIIGGREGHLGQFRDAIDGDQWVQIERFEDDQCVGRRQSELMRNDGAVALPQIDNVPSCQRGFGRDFGDGGDEETQPALRPSKCIASVNAGHVVNIGDVSSWSAALQASWSSSFLSMRATSGPASVRITIPAPEAPRSEGG